MRTAVLLSAIALLLCACTVETASQREKRLEAENAAETPAGNVTVTAAPDSDPDESLEAGSQAEPASSGTSGVKASEKHGQSTSEKKGEAAASSSPSVPELSSEAPTSSASTAASTAASTLKPGTFICSISITCSAAAGYKGKLNQSKRDIIGDGIMLPHTEFVVDEGDTVFDLLMLAAETLDYSGGKSSRYIRGINQLYVNDCGAGSGWIFYVNGNYMNISCGGVKLKGGDYVEWKYTCDNGRDL